MRLEIIKPGMLSTIQDLGRYGFQADGVSVAGAMDLQALRIGNILVGNDEGAAAIEVTITGPTARVSGDGVVALAGAALGMCINGAPAGNWIAHAVKDGDTLSFAGMKADSGGCRAMLCVSGGVDVVPVMGSRSTYTRGKLGGLEGRALKAGDVLDMGTPSDLWRECAGFVCPAALRPDRNPAATIRVVPGLQEDMFTEEGIKTLYGSTYNITTSADRMGYRMEGPIIEHKGAADIVSDAICMGSVQVPGHGQPIVMLADRQTTGGYTKIGTVCTVDLGKLAQRLPGQSVKFERIDRDSAVKLVRAEAEQIAELRRLRAAYRCAPVSAPVEAAGAASGAMRVSIDGAYYNVSWEKM